MALAPLSPFVAAIVALGLAALLTLLTLALVSFLSKAPIIGGWISNKATIAEQAISHALGEAFSGIDSFIGGCLHTLANFADGIWGGIRRHANLILALAGPVSTLWYAYAGIKDLVHRLTRTNAHADTRLKAVQQELVRLEHREKALRRELEKGIGEDVLPRIKSLDREIAKIRTQTIPAIRAADAQAESAISNLYDWAKGKAALLGVGTFAYAVAATIGLDLWKGLRCSSLLGSLNKRGCGLWQGLEDVLGLLIDGLVFLDLCHVIPLIEGVFAEFEAPLVDLVSAAANAACAQPPSGWVTLSAPPLSLPSTGEITVTL